MIYYYTKSEMKELLKSMVVLIDTREQKNTHIRGYFDKNCIEHKSRKLEFGDYSFMIPANKRLGIQKDIYFADDIAVERKANLTELSNNFTHDRTQFENELIRSTGSRMTLLIENANGYRDIINHNYNTQYNPKAFLATLHSFKHRYNLNVMFISPGLSGNFIYQCFYYWLREYLK